MKFKSTSFLLIGAIYCFDFLQKAIKQISIGANLFRRTHRSQKNLLAHELYISPSASKHQDILSYVPSLMKKRVYLNLVIGFLITLSTSAFAQNTSLWVFEPDGFTIPKGQSMHTQLPTSYKIVSLDVPTLFQELNKTYNAPADAPPMLISIPNPEGGFSDFFISPTSVVDDEVAHLYTVKTFKGYAKNTKDVTIRCDISPIGFHAVVFTGSVNYVIESASRTDINVHIVYYNSDLVVPGFKCGTDGSHVINGYRPSASGLQRTPASLRTYRLAIIADATYRTQFGGAPYNAVNVLNSMATGVNDMNEVYERDLGVHLMLVSNAACANAVLTDHTDIDAVHTFIVNSSGLGSGGFDVGHSLLWANTGGVAYLGVVCNTSYKGGGFSGANGSFTQLYIDYVAHEIGHQFGADHTFASQECNTSEPNFRYETGEGSTIMAYAGVCGPTPSYQNFSDPYFHAASIGQINTYLSSNGTCALISTPGTGNTAAPAVNAQSNITIPKQTPFILVGSAPDSDLDPVTFSWEQFNGSGSATTASPNCTSTTQPLFRFRPPVTNNFRVFPQMSDVLAGNNNTPAWEKLPCVDRTLNFRLTARDNNTNWGRTGSDDVVVTVANTGPFNVTAPNGAESWPANSSQTVNWTVNSTDSHCANVDVLVSNDNGVTYTLLGTYPNNGTASISVPNTPSTTARVLVQCSVGGNFRSASTFFDVSNAVFSITAPAPCPDLRISQIYGGGGNTSAPYTHDFIEIYNGGSATVTLNGYSVQYAGNTGTSWSSTNLTGTIAPGKYYLVRASSGGAVGVALPTPDVLGTIIISATAGKVALVNTTTLLTGACPTGTQIIDFVGYGTSANCSESANAPAPSNTNAILRANGGCTDTNNNSTDFSTGTPTPRNSASPANNCGLVLTITDNTCPTTTGTISATGCGAGTALEYATNSAGPWSTTAPTYTTSAITVYVRCRNTTTSCSGPVASGTTAPISCAACPTFSGAPANVSITNSSCGSGCTLMGGSITAPTGTPCPAGSTLQYQVNSGSWTTALPTYNQAGPAQSIRTRCACDSNVNNVSAESNPVTTMPGTMSNPVVPANGSATVACLVLATQPTPPVVTACNGLAITPTGPVVINTPNPINCEGTRTYTWTYSCGATTSNWSYIYTIERNPFTVPTNGSATVNSPALATPPTPPIVMSNCGQTLAPTGPVVTDNTNPSLCNGTRTFVWTYRDCEGNTATWSFVYTINVGGLPCDWSADLNGVGCNDGNNVSYNSSNQTFSVTSTNCYYPNSFTSDQLAFAQYDLCGNGSITAQVTSITGTALGWAGVTMRESNATGAKKAQLMTNLGSFSRREFRTTTNGQAYPQQFPSQSRYWLRITRTGSQFVMEISPNGTNWYFIGAQNITMSNCIEIGLVVTNYTANSTVTATFANVSVTGNLVKLNEIMYRPSLNNGVDPNTGEYIELRGTPGANIGCFVLTDGDWTITIPQGTILPADGIFTIGNNFVYGPGTFDLDAENCNCFSEGTGGSSLLGLTDGGEYVAFFDDAGTFIDGLMYGAPTTINTPPNGSFSIAGIINTLGLIACPANVTIPNNTSFQTHGGGAAAGTSLVRVPDITGNWTSQMGGSLNATNSNILPVVQSSFFPRVKETSVTDFSIVPNPTSGVVEIDLSSYHQRKVQMEFYNLQGKLLRTTNIESVKGKEEVDLTSFANGMYLIRVIAEGLPDVTKRVVVNSNQ
jgi:Metallo-peptidase family M12B Reprolysin-like/Lamin Tail Domain/Secretion system C-terminal sorting domain